MVAQAAPVSFSYAFQSASTARSMQEGEANKVTLSGGLGDTDAGGG